MATGPQMPERKHMTGKPGKPRKEIKPAPRCACECKACDIGIHCGRKPDCEHPSYSKPSKA